MNEIRRQFAAAATILGFAWFFPFSAAAERAEPLPGDLAAYAAVGQAVADDLQLRTLAWTDAQVEAFITGLRAGVRGQQYALDGAAKAHFDALGSRIAEAQARAREQPPAAATAPAATAPDYLEHARRQMKFERLPSGLLFRIARHGSGPRPTPTDVVVVTLKGTSPETRGGIPQLTMTKVRMKVANLLPGLIEAVQMLALDGSGLFMLPPELSFGEGAWPDGVSPGSPLLVSVELHDIEPADATP